MAAYERILLTGGAGFVGSHLAAALCEAFPDATRAMLVRPGEAANRESYETVVADLLDEAAVDRLVADLRPDLVLHLAGQSSIGQAERAMEQTWRVNFHGAFGLGSSIARHAPGAVVLFASSAAIYGATFRDGAPREDAPLRPIDVYSRSKAAAEGALADILDPGSRLLIARPVNHSGPGQRSRNFVLASFAAQIAAIEAGRAEPRIKVGVLSKPRAFRDVPDLVEAYMYLIRKARELPERVSTFNIASGDARSIGSLLEELRKMSRADFEVEVDPHLLRPSSIDISVVACDASKLRAATGWRPRYSTREMLAALLDQWRAAEASGRA
jgi:GDP-4-dehydro-6-deoxy-D-mannose reductase